MTNSKTKELLNELFGNKYDFTGTPEEVFNRYELPVRKINNIQQKINGRTKSFVFNEKEYKRVELVAKAYYESEGYTASWSEGFPIDLLEVAITAEVISKISKYFKISDEYMDEKSSSYPEWLKHQQILQNSDPKSYYLLSSEISRIYDPYLKGVMNTDLNGTATPKKEQTSSYQLLISENDLKTEIEKSIESVLTEKNYEKIEQSMEMHLEYEQNKYRNGILPQNVNTWSLDFAKVLLRRVGFDRRFCRINNKSEFACRVFDLTLISNSNEIIFVEVKNKDKLTMFQNMSIADYLDDRKGKIELCLIQVE
jgi:hypothetical protein